MATVEKMLKLDSRYTITILLIVDLRLVTTAKSDILKSLCLGRIFGKVIKAY